MTLEESVDLIENIIKDGASYVGGYTHVDIKEAIDALNLMYAKTIPKRPTGILNDRLRFRWSCPTCKEIHNSIFRYCPECGQAIDWEERLNESE